MARGRTKASAEGHATETTVASGGQNAAIDYGALNQRIGYLVKRVNSRVHQSFNELLGETGLAPGQYSILLLISLNHRLSQNAIAEAAGIDRSAMVPIVDRFVREGWVRRVRRRDDRRSYALTITAGGQALLDRAETLIVAHETQLTARLSDIERQLLKALLLKMLEE